MHSDRIRLKSLLDKVVSAEEAARFIKNGMTIGMSGFTRAGEAKAVPLALAEAVAPRAFALDNTPSDSDAQLLLQYPRVGWINGLGVRPPFSECQLQQPLLNFDRPPIVPHERFTCPLIIDPFGRTIKT
jgi:hypothetical protein